ncbi:chaplin [Streptomyces sp. NPDC060334]|uniref:chaplin n=1 Tax=unclassified Streptomyces TaxID=2593676 RepID=UPI00224EB389|nr:MULTISPECIES: chaplin [unclassified Streptomyces]WUD44543.1 chaplin [Streptomyces sp. NBC_00513]MCX5072095.1 chaplin [Streptomyces sp. NBC_00424]MCX5157236.1 chaplin [Streptomyces sp. NBC_00291]MCY0922608.1 chaplin [Streptomyces sp. H27-G5]MCY0960385.1 chaplin [Streptomyces sp. H27-H5]
MSRIAKAFAITAVAGSSIAAGAGLAVADAGAHGAAVGSPGVLSGNLVQVPVHVPVNVCGNTINVIGLLNPAFGNTCINQSGGGAQHHTAGYGG